MSLPPCASGQAALRQHLLSFQSRRPAAFPQRSFFCSHLVTPAPTAFLSRASCNLSQQATPCPTLTHLETPTHRKSAPHNSSASEASGGADESSRLADRSHAVGRRRLPGTQSTDQPQESALNLWRAAEVGRRNELPVSGFGVYYSALTGGEQDPESPGCGQSASLRFQSASAFGDQ
jgi:hypothetical protein